MAVSLPFFMVNVGCENAVWLLRTTPIKQINFNA
jgi:hypothetical protein